MTPLVAVAKLHALPGKEDEARAALQAVQLDTHKESGCLLYALHVDESDARAFVMVEAWESDDALDSHIASAYVQDLISRSPDLFTGPVDIQRLTALPNGDAKKGTV
ncbi:MAG: putative quinol monooxygenase [Solirubrobacteraceae bacterium]